MRQGDNLIVMINPVTFTPDMVHCLLGTFCRMNGMEINEAHKFLTPHHTTSNHLFVIANPKIDVDLSTPMKKIIGFVTAPSGSAHYLKLFHCDSQYYSWCWPIYPNEEKFHGIITAISSSAWLHLDVLAFSSSEKRSKTALTPPVRPYLHTSSQGLISDRHLTFMILTKEAAWWMA